MKFFLTIATFFIVTRRSWARNKEANFAIERAMKMNPNLKVTMPNTADDDLIEGLDL